MCTDCALLHSPPVVVRSDTREPGAIVNTPATADQTVAALSYGECQIGDVCFLVPDVTPVDVGVPLEVTVNRAAGSTFFCDPAPDTMVTGKVRTTVTPITIPTLYLICLIPFQTLSNMMDTGHRQSTVQFTGRFRKWGFP